PVAGGWRRGGAPHLPRRRHPVTRARGGEDGLGNPAARPAGPTRRAMVGNIRGELRNSAHRADDQSGAVNISSSRILGDTPATTSAGERRGGTDPPRRRHPVTRARGAEDGWGNPATGPASPRGGPRAATSAGNCGR